MREALCRAAKSNSMRQARNRVRQRPRSCESPFCHADLLKVTVAPKETLFDESSGGSTILTDPRICLTSVIRLGFAARRAQHVQLSLQPGRPSRRNIVDRAGRQTIAERFLPLRSGGSTSSRTKALLTDENRISVRP